MILHQAKGRNPAKSIQKKLNFQLSVKRLDINIKHNAASTPFWSRSPIKLFTMKLVMRLRSNDYFNSRHQEREISMTVLFMERRIMYKIKVFIKQKKN